MVSKSMEKDQEIDFDNHKTAVNPTPINLKNSNEARIKISLVAMSISFRCNNEEVRS